jgi:hypothetical protein
MALVVAWAAVLVYLFLERKKRRKRSAPPPPEPVTVHQEKDQAGSDPAPEPVTVHQEPVTVHQEKDQAGSDLAPEPVTVHQEPVTVHQEKDQAGSDPAPEPVHSVASSETWFQLLSDTPSYAVRAARAGLVFLALIVAIGFILILLPQNMMEKMVQTVRATKAADLPSEKIALLYLGDEVKGDEFHIRGVVRNISSEPVEKLDATVRLYSADNTLLETVVVRMHLDVIPPDATSEFHVSYPKFNGQFTSYSVDFKLRQGDHVSYKDRRGVRYLN